MNSEGCVYLGNISVAYKENSGLSLENTQALSLQSPSEGEKSELPALVEGPQLAWASFQAFLESSEI